MLRCALLVLSLLCCTGPFARAAMRDALGTARLLTGLIDTRVVRMDVPVGSSATPRRLHAVVLNFDGTLWLYTPGLGTSVLGRANEADERPEQVAARLQRLAPAVRNLRVYAHPVLPPGDQVGEALGQGCFAGCLLQLAELAVQGETIAEAGVIFFSRRDDSAEGGLLNPLAHVGHALLAYRVRGRWLAFDPARPEADLPVRHVATGADLDPVLADHARQAQYPLESVRYLPFSSAALDALASDARWRNRPTARPGER